MIIFNNIAVTRLVQIISCVCLVVLLALKFNQPVSLITSDLGRHIKNGEIFSQKGQILKTNHYSYTQPDRPVICHHWGAGVIYYWIYQWKGFQALSVLNTLIFLIGVFLVIWAASRASAFSSAYMGVLIAVPFLLSRNEIRPEILSCALVSGYLLIFVGLAKQWSWKMVPILFALQVFWVNYHIFFIFGPVMAGIFALDQWMNKSKDNYFIQLTLLLIAASLVNPWGWDGFVYPFKIFQSYGYMVAENQTLAFMYKRFPQDSLYIYVAMVSLVSIILGLGLLFFQKRKGRLFLPLMMLALGVLLAFSAIRFIALAGIWIVFSLAVLLTIFREVMPQDVRKGYQIFFYVILAGILVFQFKTISISSDTLKKFGFFAQDASSANFFKAAKIQGPIFNNYDIGGYLIFHLFPQEKIFVDNRPEAYSPAFFKDIYVPMQENENVWRQKLELYQFNAIYFFRHDMTPWAQPFLIRRISDPSWAPVFVDDYTLILLRRNAQNANIIRQFEIPKNIFVSQPAR